MTFLSFNSNIVKSITIHKGSIIFQKFYSNLFFYVINGDGQKIK